MRLFAAVVPPAEALDSLARELARLGPPDSRLRWTTRDQWHLTLAFYGSDGLDRRIAWLAPRLAEHPTERLRMAGAGKFPGVLWAGVAGDADSLQALALAAGADADERPYHPHVTLARSRERRRPHAAGAAFADLADALRDYRGPQWQASEVVLMSSEQSGRPGEGPRYTPRATFPLTPPA